VNYSTDWPLRAPGRDRALGALWILNVLGDQTPSIGHRDSKRMPLRPPQDMAVRVKTRELAKEMDEAVQE